MTRPGPDYCCRCGERVTDTSAAACDFIRDHMMRQAYIGLVCAKCNTGDRLSVTWNICRECGLQFGDYENQSPPQEGYPLCFWCEEDSDALTS